VIVIDASSISKLLLKEEGWESVVKYLDQNLCSTNFVLVEATNAIWKHRRRKGFTIDEANIAFEKLGEMGRDIICLEPIEDYLEEGFRIALDDDITIYDALYIAHAKKCGTLLTSDKPQKEMAEKHKIKVIYVTGGTATKY
jgi:predicted nucleic acid-binding protein